MRILMKFAGKFTLCLALMLSLSPAQERQQQSQRQQPAPAAPALSPEEEALRKSVGAPIDPKSYVIGAEDILMIRVWREPELSGHVGVRPDGKISLPLLGDLKAGGLTPEKLAESITQGFSKYVTNPEVMVQVASVNSKKYFISGEVMRPGSFPLVVPTTVLEALAVAGGFRDYADRKKILILRGPKRYTFNYKEIVRGKNMQQNILLESGDHIIVP
jgi:polysaccharide biosynthesis/export protein